MPKISMADISYCLRNLKNPRVIATADEARGVSGFPVPETWADLISLDGVSIPALRRLWQPVRDKLPQTMEALEERLQGMAILTVDDQPPSLLYIFLEGDGKLCIYQGFPPLETGKIPPALSPILPSLPRDLWDLYAIHDGWYLALSHSSGHLPVREWSLLSWDEWRLEKKLVERMPIRPDRTLVVYNQGGGGYLGFALPKPGETGGTRPLSFWSNRLTEPRVGIDFWKAFDEWTVAGFEERPFAMTDEIW